MNGASDLMVEVFGDKGRHARSTVGVAELPSMSASRSKACEVRPARSLADADPGSKDRRDPASWQPGPLDAHPVYP